MLLGSGLQSVQAAGRNSSEVKHALAVAAQGGYVKPYGNCNGVAFPRNSDWQLQVCYELSYDKLLMQVGAGGEFSRANIQAADYLTSVRAFDTQGTEFTYSLQFTGRADRASAVSVSVPLLLGCQVSYFYFLAGAIGSVTLYQHTRSSVNLTSWGTYDRYVSDLGDMVNHAFYTNEPISRSSGAACIWPRIQVRPHLEVGGRFSAADLSNSGYRSKSRQDITFRLAAYAEYGVLNAQGNPEYEQPYLIDTNNPYDLNAIGIPPVLNTRHYAGSFLHDLTVGLRLTVSFYMDATTRRCVTCWP